MMKLNLVILTLMFLLSAPGSYAEQAGDIAFIVNIDNPTTEISYSEIRDYYFKKKRQWSNGESVRFIDRNIELGLHDTFVRTVLKKTNSDVELFWIGQKLYSGDSAPLRKASDNGTIEFVSSFKGAIGYIPASAVSDFDLAELKVKVLKAVDTKGE
ncbi:MAG: hypothetical protein ACXWQQ_08365 [Pseudobdellovibrio sp.]